MNYFFVATIIIVATLKTVESLDLKERYNELSNEQVWESNFVYEMDGKTYDSSVADPWFGVQPFILPFDKPLVLAFI